MTASITDEAHYDPYDTELNKDPYPMFRRLREEAPLYYNREHDFYALSRFDDVHAAFQDFETFSSAKGAILEIIKSGMEIPPGILVFEDPPIHDIHRNLLSGMFTPRRMKELEPQIREYCARCLDPLVGTGRFDFVNDLGAEMPMRVIGMLLGIPEDQQEHITEHGDATIRTEPGQKMTDNPDGPIATGDVFADAIAWRKTNPSDDLITGLMNVEFEDETGTRRQMSTEELHLFLTVLATAGSETTTRLIGWAGKVLAEHPDQRRELADNPSLIPRAVEELVRFEPPAPHAARYVTRDIDFYGQTVPEGAAMMLLIGAANRDHRRFPPDGDVFDIHRERRPHLGFGQGTHFCVGNALARLEARVALEEILTRFPEWEVDLSVAELSPTSTVRGWTSMPASIP
ncbi:cytochrome P450 [Mycolicibacillus parakoreensis]|uniref:Cytochrome P450 n=1 Tax=Mycolicibacillus parakoreensis TaxID=1069221 RepID=A0ABY3TXQ2_9MYCO|nr:cytochrome P450 [Mycolicibacillus parakoreensis]MCV7317057.1 cytochrome P450 [Mycolicibacillus parakoreensis]ULN51388.1 cytochrome P450 [Mycolicibacillus parakoreensis]